MSAFVDPQVPARYFVGPEPHGPWQNIEPPLSSDKLVAWCSIFRINPPTWPGIYAMQALEVVLRSSLPIHSFVKAWAREWQAAGFTPITYADLIGALQSESLSGCPANP